MKETTNYKAVIETLLFVSNNPVSRNQLKEVLEGISSEDMDRHIGELNEDYEKSGRSFRVEEIAGGWQIRTKPEFGTWIKSLLNIQRRERLSGPALETLAIIAYKQPITRVEIEGIRGVNVDYIVNSLIEKDLVKVVGKKDVLGHPFMYGTTTRFLEHFGLASLKDLPNVEELKRGNVPAANNANKEEEKGAVPVSPNSEEVQGEPKTITQAD